LHGHVGLSLLRTALHHAHGQIPSSCPFRGPTLLSLVVHRGQTLLSPGVISHQSPPLLGVLAAQSGHLLIPFQDEVAPVLDHGILRGSHHGLFVHPVLLKKDLFERPLQLLHLVSVHATASLCILELHFQALDRDLNSTFRFFKFSKIVHGFGALLLMLSMYVSKHIRP
jgi:hypothetical protein